MTLSLRKEIKELSQDKMRKAQNNNDTRNRGQWRRTNKTRHNEERRTNECEQIKDSNKQSQVSKQKRNESLPPPPPSSSSSSSEEEYDELIIEEEEEEEENFETQFFKMLRERRGGWTKDEKCKRLFRILKNR